MQGLPIRRWNPGFIAKRWRHLLWAVPLAGLIAGLSFHFIQLFSPSATGVIQIRPLPSSPLNPAAVLRSDPILSATAASLDLPRQWDMDSRACQTRLRRMIHITHIRGTALFEVRIAGRSRTESTKIWYELLNHTNEHFAAIQHAMLEAKLVPMQAQVKALEQDLEEKRRKLSDSIQTGTLGSPAAQAQEIEILRMKEEFEAARKAFEDATLRLISETMEYRLMETPVIIHEAPDAPPPANLWKALCSPVVRSGFGIAAGIALSPILAYLFELIFSRKRPAETMMPLSP